VEVFVHELEEVPDEQDYSKEQSNGSNEVNTAFYWEANAVCITICEFVRAIAITAAAFLSFWLSIRII